MLVYIYALRHPGTGLYGYVGQSVNPENRLAQHLTSGHSKSIRQWVEDVRAAGLMPELCILEQCSEVQASGREWEWIGRLVAEGHPLANGFGPGIVRPSRGSRYSRAYTFRLTEVQEKMIERLARKFQCSDAAVVRRGLTEMARSEGLTDKRTL